MRAVCGDANVIAAVAVTDENSRQIVGNGPDHNRNLAREDREATYHRDKLLCLPSGVRLSGQLHRETHYFGSPVFLPAGSLTRHVAS